jgi:VanZ family protein
MTALVLWLSLLFVASVLPVSGPETGFPVDKAEHFVGYGVTALLFFRYFSRNHHENAFWYAVAASSAFGALMEVVQAFIPYRQFSFADMIANTAGALAVSASLRWWGHT